MKKMFLIALALFLTAGVLPAQETAPAKAEKPSFKPPMPPQGHLPKPDRPGTHRRDNAIFWRVMSSLSQEERKNLMELQAKNPDEFRKEIQKRMETLRAKEAETEKKFRQLTEDYRNADSDEKRQKIREELTSMVRERFMKRMADSERNLKDMKRRTELLEKELARKKENADQEITRLADKILSGEISHFRPPQPPRPMGPNAPFRPKQPMPSVKKMPSAPEK